MGVTKTNYCTEELIAGPFNTTDVRIAAGTYYNGQVLGAVTATALHGNFDSGDATGLEIVKAVFACDDETCVLAADQEMKVYTTASNLFISGLKNGSGDPITMTDLLALNMRNAGFILRK